MLCLSVDPQSFVVIKTTDGEIRIYNNDTVRQRVGFDAPREVKILRKELVGRDEPPKRAA